MEEDEGNVDLEVKDVPTLEETSDLRKMIKKQAK